MLNPRPYQVDLCRQVWRHLFIQNLESSLIVSDTGTGKCLGYDTPVLRADGHIVPVQDIRPGDRLMGPAGPVVVKTIARGTEMLYRVTPAKGMPYVVNESHILSLRRNGRADKGRIVNISVQDYLRTPAAFRHTAKGWRSPVDRFDGEAITLPIDPYALGLWLGDGFSWVAAICTADPEVVEAWRDHANSWGLGIRIESGSGCANYYATNGRGKPNPLHHALRELGVLHNKHIPHAYRTTCRTHRLALLAGIIDTDGYLSCGGYDLTFKQAELAEGVCFLARSVGLAAYLTPCVKGIKATGFSDTYYRISISGDVAMIPCRVPRRRPAVRRSNKNVLNVGITVEPIGVGPYYGFELEGPERLFLLGDFTVTHNTVTLAYLIQQYRAHMRKRAMVLTPRREIVNQTVRKLREAGMRTSAIMADAPYDPTSDVWVASIDSLWSWVSKGKLDWPDVGLVCPDEAHRAMGMMYDGTIQHYLHQGAKVVGATATPIRSDGVGLGRTFRAMAKAPGTRWMIQHGYLVPCHYKVGIVPDVKGVKLTAGDYNRAQLQAVMEQKLLIGDIVDNWMKFCRGRPSLYFCTGVKHSMFLAEAFAAQGVRAVHVDGYTDDEIRDTIAPKLLNGEVDIILNAAVYTEGTDIPWISCVGFAQPTKSFGKYKQQGGRGLRPWDQKEDCLFMDHAGVVNAHGRLDRDIDWQLVEGKEMVEIIKQTRDKEKVRLMCDVCRTWHESVLCPNCNTMHAFTGKAKDFLPADLADLTQGEFDELMLDKKGIKSTLEKKQWLSQFLGYARYKGYKDGWAYHQYREKFKEEPPFHNVEPMEPGVEVKNFLQHLNIRRRYRNAKESDSVVRPKWMSS